MKEIHTLIACLENISDDRIVEAVSYAIRTEAVTDGILRVAFVGIGAYVICKIIKALFVY